jgi:hypothetical protein
MAKAKQHVFSARTTEEGLRQLNRLKEEKGVGWDDLVIDAVYAHYGLDRLVMALPKAYRPEKKKEEKKNGGNKRLGKAKKATKRSTEQPTGKENDEA